MSDDNPLYAIRRKIAALAESVPSCVGRRRRGFTLIEVLVVVAIIALLVAILLPSLNKARRQARVVVCSSQLHQIGVAAMTYQHTHKDFPHQARVGVPGTCSANGPGGNVIGFWPTSVHRAIGRFIGMASKVQPNEVFFCPLVKDRDPTLLKPQAACTLGNPEEYLFTQYFYYGRLNTGNAANDPAKFSASTYRDTDRNGDGVTDDRDVPAARKLYVTKEADSRRVLMADAVIAWGGGNQWRVNHDSNYGTWKVGSTFTPSRVVDQNVAYGDGHVTLKPRNRFPEPLLAPEPVAKDLLPTVNLNQGNSDLHWW